MWCLSGLGWLFGLQTHQTYNLRTRGCHRLGPCFCPVHVSIFRSLKCGLPADSLGRQQFWGLSRQGQSLYYCLIWNNFNLSNGMTHISQASYAVKCYNKLMHGNCRSGIGTVRIWLEMLLSDRLEVATNWQANLRLPQTWQSIKNDRRPPARKINSTSTDKSSYKC